MMSLKWIVASDENDLRRFILAGCLDAYSELDEPQKQRLQAMLRAAGYQEVESLMKTTYVLVCRRAAHAAHFWPLLTGLDPAFHATLLGV